PPSAMRRVAGWATRSEVGRWATTTRRTPTVTKRSSGSRRRERPGREGGDRRLGGTAGDVGDRAGPWPSVRPGRLAPHRAGARGERLRPRAHRLFHQRTRRVHHRRAGGGGD